jgi:predicted DCC family thiol-disulfide oxidoreductase YuxK
MGGDFGEEFGACGETAFLAEAWRLTGPWILYDGDCPLCRRGEEMFGSMMRRRGFRLETLQGEVGGYFAGGRTEEVRVVTREGRMIGGAEGFAYICGHVWWALPVAWAWRIHGLRGLMRMAYRWVAAHRGCDGKACGTEHHVF